MWRDLGERGWTCVYDSEYGPDMNTDAAPLFALYPRLMQRHGSGIWCAKPGLALIAAFRDAVRLGCEARPIAARIAALFSDNAIIALTDALGRDGAAHHIFAAARDGAEELNPLAYLDYNKDHA